MREIDRIVEQLQRAYDGDAWFGASVRSALEGVDARVATTGPLESTHTIAEIVLHVTAWTREVTRRLRTGVARDPDEGDWPYQMIDTEAEWAAVLDQLEAAQADLLSAVAALNDAQLDERIGEVRDRELGSGVSLYVTLQGLAQHHAYHAGQIAMLKRSASTPA
jgi:uncharacterized damage-inducible protein DinB